MAAAVFAGSLDGEFVYDDRTQILGNRFIQDPALLGAALRSDVHAFKDRTTEASRDRWRPAFVAWLIANERLWGVEDPRGWHVVNVALHASAVVLAWFVLLALGLGRAPAGAAVVRPYRMWRAWLASARTPFRVPCANPNAYPRASARRSSAPSANLDMCRTRMRVLLLRREPRFSACSYHP